MFVGAKPFLKSKESAPVLEGVHLAIFMAPESESVLVVRIRIQESQINAEPCGSGSE
jgi:hypothetical protein